ncbi:hypothetical protein TgHK011_000082 [Trichoderma gracile]|nr:hypothetical protein TgHK011_000082 [Trichoderma gracile]
MCVLRDRAWKSDPGLVNVESTISYELMAGQYASWRLAFYLPIRLYQFPFVALKLPDTAIYPDKSIHLNVSYFLRKLYTGGAFTHRTWNLISPGSITTSRNSLLVCGSETWPHEDSGKHMENSRRCREGQSYNSFEDVWMSRFRQEYKLILLLVRDGLLARSILRDNHHSLWPDTLPDKVISTQSTAAHLAFPSALFAHHFSVLRDAKHPIRAKTSSSTQSHPGRGAETGICAETAPYSLCNADPEPSSDSAVSAGLGSPPLPA